MEAINVITWTFVTIFVATAIITLGGLVENFRLIQVSEKYLKGLYIALILEVIAAAVSIAVVELSVRSSPMISDSGEWKPAREKGEKSAGALIVGCHNDKPAMLGVLHNINNRIVFSPPGGNTKKGEEISVTAIRETKEETGYTIAAMESLGSSPTGNTNFYLILAHVDEQIPADPHFKEVVGLIWIDPKDVPQDSWRFPSQRDWIIELFEEHSPTNCE